MKQIFLFGLILLQYNCYSQVVNEYLENAKWTLFYTCEPEQNFFQDVELELSIGEDTIISGLTYKKVHLDNQSFAQFFLRQDSSKIYHRSANPNADPIEFEVYDFSIEEGDTYVYPNEFYETEYVVTDVDSIELLDDTKRKRITFSDSYNIGCAPVSEITQWVEGIGGIPTTSLYFYQDYCWCEFRGFTFSVDDVMLYESDLLIDNVDEAQISNFDFRQNENQIVVLSNAQIDHLIIYGIDGRTMSSTEGRKNIQINHLTSGIYILEAIFRNQTSRSIKFFK